MCAPSSLRVSSFLPIFVSTALILGGGGADTLASPTELTRVWEVEDAVALVFAHDDAEGLVWKVALLEGELTKVC
jgi:hypothetical protein